MSIPEKIIGRLVGYNNALAARSDDESSNPRDLTAFRWADDMEAAFPAIRREWDGFVDGGGRLPMMEQLIMEDQGNTGTWRAGLLFHSGRPVEPLASRFPNTVSALSRIPDLRYALFSVMEADSEIGDHVGPNAGVLRYHLGITGTEHSALRIGEAEYPYRDGRAIMFDDTVVHAGWNRGEVDRVTLFCEIERPLSGWPRLVNGITQRAISLDGRYKLAPQRAAEWDSALNH